MTGKENPRMADILTIFESWRLKQRSEKLFRLTHPCDALDDPSIIHYEYGGLLAIDIEILKRHEQTVNRTVPVSEITEIPFYNKPQAEPPEEMINCENEFPIRSSLERKICPDCDGEEKEICHICSGKEGKIKCRYCGGKGRISARMSAWDMDREGNHGWDGGKVRMMDKICPKCSGMGITVCFECKGKGFHICRKCNGEGAIYEFQVVIQKYKLHQNTIRIVSEDNIIQVIDEWMNKLARPSNPTPKVSYSSIFDAPLRSEKNKFIPVQKAEQSNEYDKIFQYDTSILKWPISPNEFSSAAGVTSSGLSRLFERAVNAFRYIDSGMQIIKDNIVRTKYSAEFTPISHLIFSKVNQYDKQFHFSLIGTPARCTILPPKLSSSLSISPNNVFKSSLFAGLYGGFILSMFTRVSSSSMDFIDQIAFLTNAMAFFLLALSIWISFLLYRAPSAIKASHISYQRKRKKIKANGRYSETRNYSDVFKTPNNPREHLVLLAGNDCPEKARFFCFLNFELCRKRWISISDQWVHEMLALFLDDDIPSLRSSFLCNWKDLSCESSTDSERTDDSIHKNFRRKDKIKKNGRNIRFLSVPFSFFQDQKQQGNFSILKLIDSLILVYLINKINFVDDDAIERCVEDISDGITKIASSRDLDPENIPIFVVFNGFERKNAMDVISELKHRNIDPRWEIIDINLMKDQYLEGQFEKYENFINTFWNFIKREGK